MDDFVRKMQQDIVIRNYSPRTVESYLWHVKAFQAHIQKPLEQVTEVTSAPTFTMSRR